MLEKIERLSITQIKAYQRNPFYWAYSYFFKLPQPETDALIYGKTLHSAIESILKGESFPLDIDNDLIISRALEVASRMFPLIDSHQIRHDIEHEFNFSPDEGIPPLKGIIDIYIHNFEGNTPLIIDHKTVKSKKYALKEKDLKKDLQLSLYAYYAAREEGAYVQHNQVFKESDEISEVRVFLSSEEIEHNFKEIVRCSKEILDFFSLIKHKGFFSIDVQEKKNCGKCRFMYGGCPYARICDGKMSIEDYRKEKEQMTTENTPQILQETVLMADLSSMMAKARAFHEQKIQNKFDLRDAIASSIVQGIKKNSCNAVLISQFLLNAGDPDYQPVLNRIKESGARIFVEIR